MVIYKFINDLIVVYLVSGAGISLVSLAYPTSSPAQVVVIAMVQLYALYLTYLFYQFYQESYGKKKKDGKKKA